MESASDSTDMDSGSEPPRTLSEIEGSTSDDESEDAFELHPDPDKRPIARCDFCHAPLGALDAGEATRLFRCGARGCDSAFQCGSCCFEHHLCRREHPLEEWSNATDEWCIECNSGLLCRRCCKEEHECEPLHNLKVWNEQSWEVTSLREIGFVYQMGHKGDPCQSPTPFVHSLLVIDLKGCHRLDLLYCACGKYPGGVSKMGRWLQIRDNGWYQSTLNHGGICTTFKVW
ncbi:hypothetical protein C8R43DRAFT_963855 [Mycena crocata]|nr:hypothetical protein C8R43DRAFT_963855 [Mycena crocata]